MKREITTSRHTPDSAFILSLTAAVLAAGAAGWGLIEPSLYQQEKTALALQLHAMDIVTLFLVTPLTLFLLFHAWKDRLTARLAWLGVLAHYGLTYLQYSAGATVNALFPVYTAVYALAGIAFFQIGASLNIANLPYAFPLKTPRKAVGWFGVAFGLLLAAMNLPDALAFTIYGTRPAILAGQVSQALFSQTVDLGMAAPLFLIGGALLLRDRPFGYLLASVYLIKSITFITAKVILSISLFQHGQTSSLIGIVLWTVPNALAIFLALRFFIPSVQSSQNRPKHMVE